MKRTRVLSIVLAAGLALVVAGCAQSGSGTHGEDDDGADVTLKVGDQFVVELPSNPTTGFSWTVAESGPLTQVGEAKYQSEAEEGVVGAGGIDAFTFKAERTGSGTLTLEYRRSWETGVAAEDVWSVTVTVK
jgi:inhibitor of cysteine peptidase